MKKTLKVRNNKIEIKKNVWVDLDNNTIFKRFPKIKKLILKRECLNKITQMIVVPNIDFKMLMFAALGSTLNGYSMACTGQNQGYNRKIYDNVSGFDSIREINELVTSKRFFS